MAVSFSCHSSSIPRFSDSSSPSCSSKPSALTSRAPHLKSKTLAFPVVPRSNPHFLSRPIPFSFSFPAPLLSITNTRRFFKPNFNAEDSANVSEEEANDKQADGEAPDSDVESTSLPSLEALLQTYKKAILAGDDRVVSDIEAILYKIQSKKNEFVEKVSALSAELASGKEKYIRLQADFDNFRKRLEKERLTIRSNAQGEVMESLLPMIDNFERAKQQLKPETEKERKIDTSYQGIYKQFVEIMRSLHVAVVPTVGKPFDPSVHEAIAREESEEFKEGVVIEEFRRGFLLKDRLLRPAMVKVSSGSGKKPASHAEKTTDQPTAAAGVNDL